MTQLQKELPDAFLTEVWTLMHLAVAPDPPSSGLYGMGPSPKGTFQSNTTPDFICEGEIEDGEFDGNANEMSKEDRNAFKESADLLASIGDSYSQDKEEENKLIDDIVQCLERKARNIDERLERELTSNAVPASEMFTESLVAVAYSEVKSRLETFLVGSQGFSKIAMVTHITIGVSAALRNVSAPAVSLAAALSYRFVTDNCADLILEGGGLRNLVHSNSQ